MYLADWATNQYDQCDIVGQDAILSYYLAAIIMIALRKYRSSTHDGEMGYSTFPKPFRLPRNVMDMA
jgi:hypothetical protein